MRSTPPSGALGEFIEGGRLLTVMVAFPSLPAVPVMEVSSQSCLSLSLQLRLREHSLEGHYGRERGGGGGEEDVRLIIF